MHKLISILMLICIIVVFSSCSKNVNESVITNNSTTNVSTNISNTKIATTHSVDYKDTKITKILNENIPNNNGEWSIYYKNLKTNKYAEINNKKMVSASLTKLFIMGTVYDEIKKGNLKDTNEIEELMEKMITISHNDSSNKLVQIVGKDNFKCGMKVVNAFSNRIGCSNTEQQRSMLDSRPHKIPQQNYTSVKDCAIILEKIYEEKCINKKYDKRMLGYLLNQQRKNKIPSGIPSGTKVANKTGELSDVENDVAIVYTDKGNYILCIISNNLNNTNDAQNSIKQISKVVYNYVVE